MKFKSTIIIVCSIAILFLGWYVHRLVNADLLTNWGTSGGLIGGGSEKYYAINSKDGSKTYVPSFLTPIIGYNSKKEKEAKKNWSEKISRLNSEFAYSTYISGQLDENTIIFLVLKQGTGKYDMYKYNIDSNQYEFLMHENRLRSCVAGNGKIFYRLSVVGSGTARELKDAIYRYYPDTGEKVKIAEYYTNARNLSLEKVLK